MKFYRFRETSDMILFKVIKLLKLSHTNFWELKLYHENGKLVNKINEVAIDEKMLFATFNASFYKKHRLLEMFAASYVETYTNPEIIKKHRYFSQQRQLERSKGRGKYVNKRGSGDRHLNENKKLNDLKLQEMVFKIQI
jgi:hypothetical protein